MINLRIVFSTLLVLFAFNSFGQIQPPPKWTYTFDTKEAKVGDEIELIFQAEIPQNWYIYSNDFDEDLGPMLTTVKLEKHPSFEVLGELMPINPSRKYDDIWAGEVSYFMGTGEFRQRIRILQSDLKIIGNIDYQMCIELPNDSRCIPFDEDFTFPAIPISGSANEETSNAGETDSTESEDQITPPIVEETIPTESRQAIPLEPIDANGNTGEMSLWAFMILCFLGGIAALLTPCVYPMIPLTVSFFTGKSKSRRQALIQAFFYGFSIIAIYTISGTIVAKVSGPEFANWLSTHWVPNVAFFAIFIFFALAFLGMFEITLPSSWVNNADKQADKGGYYGTFFMAFTLVLVSFSCTGPIVGTILVESAGGLVLKPILGMFAFSMAFAIPFTLFAIFPEWLNSLPRSGGWMNTVKVVLGFLELALAFKFLSIADQVYHWGILDRDIFLVIWIAVFIGLTIYLFGFIRMPHDDKVEKLGVPRLLLAFDKSWFCYLPNAWLMGRTTKRNGWLPPAYEKQYVHFRGWKYRLHRW
jgi:thiol:disulfide interchange protein